VIYRFCGAKYSHISIKRSAIAASRKSAAGGARYETGEREADYKTLIAFAEYFHVSVDYLLGRTDNPDMTK